MKDLSSLLPQLSIPLQSTCVAIKGAGKEPVSCNKRLQHLVVQQLQQLAALMRLHAGLRNELQLGWSPGVASGVPATHEIGQEAVWRPIGKVPWQWDGSPGPILVQKLPQHSCVGAAPSRLKLTSHLTTISSSISDSASLPSPNGTPRGAREMEYSR